MCQCGNTQTRYTNIPSTAPQAKPGDARRRTTAKHSAHSKANSINAIQRAIRMEGPKISNASERR